MLLPSDHFANDSLLRTALNDGLYAVRMNEIPPVQTSLPKYRHYDDYILSKDRLFELMEEDPHLDTCVETNLWRFDFKITHQSTAIVNALYKYFPKHSIRNTGHFLYKHDGYMGWHTNAGSIGLRLYCVYAEEDHKSYFGYWDGSEIIKVWDNKGWNFRLFDITHENPLWHCVYSQTNRYSFGYKMKQVLFD